MKTKNLLITICLLFYVITDAISQNAGIPVSEYNALVDLYNSTLGEEWTNNSNWLDTLNHSVADWYGVTVENGHVTQILLNNNALQNSAFTEIIYLPKLRCLELGNNKLTGFNFAGTDSLANLDTLILFGNALIFEDLSPAFSTLNYPNFSEHFYYFPQEKIDVPENVTKYDGQFFSFDISQEYISTNDKFQWYNDTTLIVGENSAIIQFSPVTQANSGTYHVEITNPDVPNLRLQSYDKTLYVNSSVGAGVPLSEYNALVDFYNSTQGNNWTNNTNWLDTIDHEVNDWYGITVENGHVTEIYFGPYEKYNLNGSIPNSIKDLPKLESFVIVTDDLNGELPEGLYELKNLKTLYLSECRLSGQLSPSIGNLTNLEKLGLEANNFNGSIPYEIGYLSHLKFLSLYENGFTGKIPSSIGNLTNLEYLGLSQNNLNGTIPASIGNLTNLGWLLLNGNQITGPLPIELVNLENIIKINIENNLIGFIDSTLKSATITNTFSVDNRQIPDELSGLIQMDTLYLAGNNLQFNDIEAIFNWENYRDFKDFVYSPQDNIGIQKTLNKYTGENTILSIDNYYPGPSDKYQWFKNNSAIQGKTNMELELTNIQLTDAGEYYCKVTNLVASELTLTSQKILLNVTKSAKGAAIPVFEYNALVDFYHSTNGESWGYNANWLDTTDHTVADWVGIILEGNHVSAINLDSNNVTGILPATIANLSNLKMISLEKNGISGIIPDNIGNLSNLETLSLSSNNISGEIPNSIIEMENLKYLLLSGNNLEGEVPSEIGNDTNLEGIWLNYNNLSGEIPASLGNLSKLRHLYLDHNLFTGTIPASLGNLTDLRTLDLSNNQLVGPLPVELQNLTKLSRLEIDNNLIGDIDFNKSANIENYRQIPDELAGLLQMDTLYIGDNNLQFNDIEAIFNWDNYIDFNDFIYTPQDSIGSSKTIEKLKGEDVVLSIDNYYAGPSDKYQWFKNEMLLSGKTDANLTLTNIQLSDSGQYYCEITNPVANELTLTSRKINLNVKSTTGSENIQIGEIKIFPNPASQQIFIDTKNKVVELKIYNISGITVYENDNFSSDWINIETFPPGIYLFKIVMENIGAINKGVIFD